MAENLEDKAPDTESSVSPVNSKRNVRSLKQAEIPGAHTGPETMTALQQHVSFFDRDKDGIIYPWETFAGFRALRFNVFFSAVIALLLNVLLSYATLPGWIPSLWFPIYVKNIHKDKHGSDTDIYDREGRFVPEKFEELFSKYALTSPNKLTAGELWKMTEDNREIYDIMGWILAKFEWALLYYVAKDDGNFVSEEAVRGCYDGTLFEYLATEHAKKMV